MKTELKILILEDSPDDAELIQWVLKKEGMLCKFNIAMNKRDFLKAIDDFSPDVVLSDNSLPQFNAIEALKLTRHRLLHVPFILVTGTVSEEYAAEIISSGADDYILKDRMTRLPAAISAALKKRRAEKEIADYKYALDQSAIVAITDQKGIILYANENFCRISKYSKEELIGQDHRIINSGYHPASYIRYLWVTIANGRIWRGEFCNSAKDGSMFWVDTTIVPFTENRKPYQYLAIHRDINEKKKAEQELSRNELRFRTLTSNAPVGIFQTDTEGKTIYVNETWLEYTGLTFEEAMGSGWHTVLHPDDKEKQMEQWEVKSQSGLESYSEFRLLDKKGNIRWVTGRATPMFDKNKAITGYIGTLSDITERKKLEQELLEQQRNEQLKITATALEAQEKERTLLGQELHDNVNQILVGSKLLLSMARNKPEKREELISICIDHLQEAIEENRKLSHKLVTPDLELESLSKQLSHLVHDMFETAGVKTNIDAKNFQEDLLSDQQKITVYRIAQEQCTNIIKYAKAGNVIISLQTTGGFFKMLISDDGQGMEAGKTTKGIGLQNITGRLSIFNGKAEIKTEPGKGFTLDVEMPVKP